MADERAMALESVLSCKNLPPSATELGARARSFVTQANRAVAKQTVL